MRSLFRSRDVLVLPEHQTTQMGDLPGDLMKLSNASLYTINALAFLAAQGDKRLVASHLIAQAKGIPEKFMLKILRPLVSVGILASLKGPAGGYRLAKAPNQITLLEIIEAVDGPVRGQLSSLGDGTESTLNRRLEKVFDRAAEEVRRKLAGVRLSGLVTQD
jgi:Rrf2 family protein